MCSFLSHQERFELDKKLLEENKRLDALSRKNAEETKQRIKESSATFQRTFEDTKLDVSNANDFSWKWTTYNLRVNAILAWYGLLPSKRPFRIKDFDGRKRDRRF